MNRRERRKRRKDIAAAQRMLGWLHASTGTDKQPEELIVEGWLWLVAGEDEATRAALSAAVEQMDGELPEHWNDWWDARKLTVAGEE